VRRPLRLRRLSVLGAALLFLLAAAPPPKIPAPPPVGVKTASVSGARRVDAVLPGTVIATAFPRGADGKRRILVLVAPKPDSPRELYLVDTAGAGGQRRLLGDLPAEASLLTAAALGGKDGDEILLGSPGMAWTLGTADTPAAPRRFLDGVDLRHLLLSDSSREIAAAEVGRLRTWTHDGSGKLTPGRSFELPVRARRERGALRLDTPEVEVLSPGNDPQSNASPFYLVGPEANGKNRLHTLILTRDAEGKPQQSESWSRFSGPETVDDHWFVRVDGEPMLIVTSNGAAKVSVFEEQSLRVFPLTADRSRAGQPPRLAAPTVSRRWFPARPFVLDLDRDGHDDLVVVQQEGLRGKALVVETWFGQGGGRFAAPSRKVSLDLQARAWEYGADVTGDGRPDLVAIEQTKLLVFAGTADPRRDLLDRRPRLSIPLPASEPVAVSASLGSEGALVEGRSAHPLQLIDLDGDGRPEIIITVRDEGGHGRVTVVRVGG
jgi:hypothetical protein